MYRNSLLTAKEQALMIEPSCACECLHRGKTRFFEVVLQGEVLGSAISPSVAWERALSKLLSQRAVDHINGNVFDDRPENLRIVTVKESFGTKNRQRL